MLCSTRRFAKRFAPVNEMSPALRRGGCSSPRRGDTSFRPAGHKPRQRRGGIASGGCAEAFRARRGRNIPNFIRQIFNGRKRSDPHHSSCDAEARFYGRPLGRSDYGQRNKKRTTERLVFLRASAISRPLALFSPPSFLLREKRWCRRRHPAPAAQRAGSTRKGCAASVVHLTALTAAQSRPPLRKVGNVPNFIRQIFNGRTRNDTQDVSCAQETRFYGRPLGRSDYGQRNKKRTTERFGFLRVSAISASSASFLHTFFWQDRKKYARGATVAVAQ